MPNKTWFLIGQAVFGCLIGFLVGLSISPIVSTVVGLLFAAIGGSIVALIKGRSEEELEVIGKSIAALALSMIVGVTAGIYLRTNDLLTMAGEHTRLPAPAITAVDRAAAEKRAAALAQSLTVADVKLIGAKKGYEKLLCELFVRSPRDLSREDLVELVQGNVNPVAIQALMGLPACDADVEKPKAEGSGRGSFVYTDPDSTVSDGRDDIPSQ